MLSSQYEKVRLNSYDSPPLCPLNSNKDSSVDNVIELNLKGDLSATDVSENKKDAVCVICFENRPDAVFMPCGHGGNK